MKIFVAIFLSLLLTACQSTKLDAALQKNLPVICRTANNLHTAFLAAAASGNISDAKIRKEAAGYDSLQAFCADPGSVNSQNLLIAAAQAYATYVILVRSK